ncbi:MAG: phosphonate C-P lyase system protein PhnH [Desulfobulbaceae bacterium A2]|nr:MAG: phosphonate C-P lyase system protein PhnH [Desulfobulbaceae bacterium A2]
MLNKEIRQHAVFRSLLRAMSRPGQAWPLPQAVDSEPRHHLLTVVEAMCDYESSFHLAGKDQLLAAVVSHGCGAPTVPVEKAAFLLAPEGSSHGLLGRLHRGTPDFPDRGATVVYQVKSFAGKGPSPLLSGPGIRETVRPTLAGLDPSELPALAVINRDFPLGVDVLFVSHDGQVMGLPRSTRIGM